MHSLRRLNQFNANQRAEIIYSLKNWDSTTEVSTSNLHLYSRGTDRPLTKKVGVQDTSPTFSSDGQFVAFLSSRSGSSQVHLVPFVGSEEEVTQLTQFPIDIDNFWWVTSKNGDFLVYTMQVYPDCPTLQCTADRDKEVAARGPNTWKLYDSLFVRHWDQWETGKTSHIFSQKISNIAGHWILLGSPKDLMPGLKLNSPVPPFGGAEQIDISPDGEEIAFTAEVVNRERAWSTSWRIFIVSSNGSSLPVCIVDSIAARTQNPKYSPDGQWLAYLAMDIPGYESDKLHINLYNRKTKATSTLTKTVDISFSGIIWDKYSQYILADADYKNVHALFALKVSDLEPKYQILPILSEGTVGNVLRVDNTNLFYFIKNRMTAPDDIWKFNFTNGEVLSVFQLTFVNEDILRGVEFQEPEQFSFVGSLGDIVYGWFLKPYGFDPSHSWPLANLIHGGPEAAWLDVWSYRWNPQLWTARGYAVVMINFHGSTGFGQKFVDAINGNWGSYPYWDIMKGTMAILEGNSWIDPTRVAACGASYGGYMVNWIQGQTDFFKALVTHDGMFDTTFVYYSTEELWFPEREFLSPPFKDASNYEKWNPARFVSNWKTPHLIIHGQNDFRLTLSHGLAAFTALQRQGIPSQFLYMTEENHWVLNPANSIQWYTVVLNWLDQWTKADRIVDGN